MRIIFLADFIRRSTRRLNVFCFTRDEDSSCASLFISIFTFSFGWLSLSATADDNQNYKQRLDYANADLVQAIAERQVEIFGKSAQAPSKSVEAKILNVFGLVESYCAIEMKKLVDRKSTYAKKDAHVNAWGGLLALLGGVAGYAPVKAVLMGVGISSSGGSNSVLGGMANSFSDQQDSTSTEISTLKSNFSAGVSRYSSIAASDDLLGTRRFNVLTEIKAACDGFSVSNSPTQSLQPEANL